MEDSDHAFTNSTEDRPSPENLTDISCPAISLPDELLAIIFEIACLHASDGHASPMQEYGHDLRYIRSSISSTCWRWRSVVLNTTSLWSTIVYYDEAYEPWQMKRSGLNPATSYHLLDKELARSDRHPLSLYLLHRQSPGGTTLNKVLRDNIGRCRTLHVDLYQHEDITNIFDLISSSASGILQLRHLTIHHPGSFTLGAIDGMVDLTNAVELQDLSVRCGMVLGDLRASVIFPQPSICNLRRLDLEGPCSVNSLTQICLALQSCRRLETFKWSLPQSLSLHVPGFEEVCLPNLLNLSISGFIAMAWLGSLNAPRLEKLFLVVRSHGLQSYAWDCACKFSPTLRHFDFLDTKSQRWAGLHIPFLQSHPNLEIFRTNFMLDWSMIEYLGHINSPEFRSAKLKSVTFSGLSPRHWDATDSLLSRLLALRGATVEEHPLTLHPYDTREWNNIKWRAEHERLSIKYSEIVKIDPDPAIHTSPWDWVPRFD